jgi:general secretion pathway protein G
MTKNERTRREGFTLVEIMAVVVIMGLLAGLVGTAVVGNLAKARSETASAQIKQLESALTFYQMDNGRFPTTDQGLQSLVEKPAGTPEPRNYRDGGYLQTTVVPKDPWGQDYQYLAPGQHNPQSFDIWTLGADGAPGGDGGDRDVGNWAAESE